MEQLNRLIKDASNQFECKNFQTSLQLYIRCIKLCVSEKLPKYVLNNLKSSEAALRTTLGQYETALKILNQVLNQDKQHWLSLIRRNQVYIKLNNFKKALKDLDILFMYAPDNLQLIANKLEIKIMMSNISGNSSESSYEEQQQIDWQQILKFSNLKMIDRTSVSIMLPKNRQSRVTISGDTSYFYESAAYDNNQKIRQSKSFTPSFNCKRFIQIVKQLQGTNSYQKQIAPIIIKSKPTRTKSILKNRGSNIYISNHMDQKTKQQLQSLIEKVQDIDGNVIKSSSNFESIANTSQKEVDFRKSLYSQQSSNIQNIPIKSKSKSGGRKSCLKMCSFSSEKPQFQTKAQRSSKFDSLPRISIDGKFIRSDLKKKTADIEVSKQNILRQSLNNQGDGSQSDEGSQFNIFGSKKVLLNKQLRENLGLNSDSFFKDSQPSQKKPKTSTHSILKASSITIKNQAKPKKNVSIFFREQENQDEAQKPEIKKKKSVMFLN